MKHIHFPTLLLHGLLLLLAAMLLQGHQDGFLLCAGVLLGGHVIFCCISSQSPALTHLLGCAIQGAVFALELIPAAEGPLSLGSGLALYFYLIALAVTAALEIIILLIRYYWDRR